MIRNVVRGCLGAAIGVAALSAQALTLGLTGYSNGSVDVSGGTPGVTTGAGSFKGSLSGAGAPFDANPFYTYCVEIGSTFSWGSPLPGYSVVGGASYFASAPFASASAVDRLGKLFTVLGGIGMPATTTISAAIQMAIWESIYETGATLNVGTNSFKIDSASDVPGTDKTIVANSASWNQANTYLAAASALTTSQYAISVLKNDAHQDFLLVSYIPEPGSLALAGIALGALVVARRRRV